MQFPVAGEAMRRRGLKNTVSTLALAGMLAGVPALAPLPALARSAPESFAELIDQVGPAVVQITAQERLAQDRRGAAPQLPSPDQLPEGPFRDFLERFFQHGMPGMPGLAPDAPDAPGRMPGPRPERAALGSGFIVSADGIVVTNNHVVGDAQEIRVTLKDGSSFPARLVGSDEKTDLAVLKIEADRPLPTVGWGDSDRTRVGDWVIAVGHPFGLTGTVTAGIVSSRGRNIGAGPYDDFIQIDAPINTGNSGGPLFDVDGRVVGVNTAIYSPNGGSVGIGFAIPSNIAHKIVAELNSKGSVERGWLGVSIQPVTPEVADSLALPKPEGALVAEVSHDGPAAKAGVRQGDVVLRFGDATVASPRELSRTVAETAAGATQRLTVWRNGREVTLDVRIGEMPKRTAALDQPSKSEPAPAGGVELSGLGLTLAPLDAPARTRFGLAESTRGALVTAVDGQADAAEKGMRPGDVITRINQDAVAAPTDAVIAVEKAKAAQRKAVLLLIERQGEQRFVAVEFAST